MFEFRNLFEFIRLFVMISTNDREKIPFVNGYVVIIQRVNPFESYFWVTCERKIEKIALVLLPVFGPKCSVRPGKP